MGYSYILKDKKKLRVLARVVAHLMGDGCVTGRYFAYYNKNLMLLKIYEKDIKSLFPNVHIIRGKQNSGTLLLQVQNKEIINFLKSLVKDYRSNSLKIPNFVGGKDLLKEFLQALYDDEGTVGFRRYRKTNEIKRNLSISSNSKKLLREIKGILLREFDINSNRIYKYTKIMDSKIFVNFTLSITGRSNFQKFRDEIDFTHPEKKIKLDNLINSYLRLASTI